MWKKTLSELTRVTTSAPTCRDCGISDVGVAEAQGWRPTMEDAHLVELDSVPGAAVFAVFDGHGGHDVSAHVAKELMPRFARAMEDKSDAGAALQTVLIDIDFHMRTDLSLAGQLEQTGSTAVCVCVEATQITSCWLGDSRAVLSSAGKVIALSDDHKPSCEAERERISRADGQVVRGRVNGVLAVSRALGDYVYKSNEALSTHEQLVSCCPETRRRPRENADEFIIVACDGIWEKVSNEQAVAFVRAAWQSGEHDAAQIARRLVEWSMLSGSTDNMTCCVVILNERLLDGVGEEEARRKLVSASLSAVAVLRAREALRIRFDDVKDMLETDVLDMLDRIGFARHVENFSENRVDGTCLVETSEHEFADDLRLPAVDAKFITLALQWWQKTSSWS
mmetsp:Transcript_20330/g.68928  ORF Transcript_20330/g.68928 Transcript_20330/m.68928 type:complete len:395 (+) Transcript_20330:58-1242(+)